MLTTCQHPSGGQVQRSGLLLPLLVCLVFLLIGFSVTSNAWATHQDYDELSAHGSERWTLEPGRGRMWREKRATGTTTTTGKPGTTTVSSKPSSTSSKPTAASSKAPVTTAKPSKTSSKAPATSSKVPTTTKHPTTTSSKSPNSSPKQPAASNKLPTTTPKPKSSSSKSPTSASKPSTTSSKAPKGSSAPSKSPTSSSKPPPPPPTTTVKPPAAPSKAPTPSSKPSIASTKPPLTPPKPPGQLPSIISKPVDEIPLGNTNYEARDIALYLDSNLTYSFFDPRFFYTLYSPMEAAFEIRISLIEVPEKSRFAYLMRTFNELGRKVASRINMFNNELLALFRRAPDGLGSKPTLDAYVDAVEAAFRESDAREIINEPVKSTPKPSQNGTTNSPSKPSGPQTISSFLSQDKEMADMFNKSIYEVSTKWAQDLGGLFPIVEVIDTQLFKGSTGRKRLKLLGAAMKNGLQTMIKLMSKNDKFKPDLDAIGHVNNLLNEIMARLEAQVGLSQQSSAGTEKRVPENNRRMKVVSDLTSLMGPYNHYLFEGLGTANRLVRVFTALLELLDGSNKRTFITLYISQFNQELNVTMSSFVALMASGSNNETSDKYLVEYIDEKTLKKNQTRIMQDILKSHELDKSRLPARCYLTGRRWRLGWRRAMLHFDGAQDAISKLVDRVNQIKATAMEKKYPSELDRLCLPRLEMGLKGWGINGEPTGETDTTANMFPLRQPIEGLHKNEEPFTSGANMGYRIGFMIGYNDKRNQSLEMEARDPAHGKPRELPKFNLASKGSSGNNKINSSKVDESDRKKKAEVDYLARASYRQGLTAGAKKALEIACREGYMTTLKVSVRAGMLLPLEAGASLASLKASNFAKIAGSEAGRNFVNCYLMDRDLIDETVRSQLMEVGMAQGSLAGTNIGEAVGSIVGHEAALEAYKRSITRGGKVTRAKFHLDVYLEGAKLGFDHGLKEGGDAALSIKTGQRANKFFKLEKPQFSSKISSAFGHAANNKTVTKRPSGSRSGLIQLPASLPTTSTTGAATSDDHWGQDVISPLSEKTIADFHEAKNHFRVEGSIGGTYNVAKEVKSGLQRVSYNNVTYELKVHAVGYSMHDITYLSLRGSINGADVLRGSLLAPTSLVLGTKYNQKQ